MFSQNNCLTRFVYLLKHDSHLGIDQDVSTAYCRSSSGEQRVGLLVPPRLLVIGGCITNLTHGWRVLIRLRSDKRSRKPFIDILRWTISFMTERLLFGICMLCNRPFTQVNRKTAVSRNEASPCILCKIVHTPLQRNARKDYWLKCLHPHYQRSRIRLFSPVIFTQISAQSRNLDPNFRLIPSSQPKFPLNPVILMVILRIPHPLHTFIPESRPILL